VIEEFPAAGELHRHVDGRHVLALATSQDHKARWTAILA
jgi:hypothetical protein